MITTKLQKKLFAGQSKNSRTPFTIEDWSAKSAMPQNQWERIVEEKVKKCNIMVVLIGRHLNTATGVKKEIDMALRNNVPVFGVYVDNATSNSTIPSTLVRSNVVDWKWDKIASKIDIMMTRGKNRG